MPVVMTTSRTATLVASGASFVMWRTFPRRREEDSTMKSIQQVLWRGALALGLMAIGVGTSIGMPPAERAMATDCPIPPPVLLVAQASDQGEPPDPLIVLRRRPLTPAG